VHQCWLREQSTCQKAIAAVFDLPSEGDIRRHVIRVPLHIGLMVTDEYVGVCCSQAMKWLEHDRDVDEGRNWNNLRTVG